MLQIATRPSCLLSFAIIFSLVQKIIKFLKHHSGTLAKGSEHTFFGGIAYKACRFGGSEWGEVTFFQESIFADESLIGAIPEWSAAGVEFENQSSAIWVELLAGRQLFAAKFVLPQRLLVHRSVVFQVLIDSDVVWAPEKHHKSTLSSSTFRSALLCNNSDFQLFPAFSVNSWLFSKIV